MDMGTPTEHFISHLIELRNRLLRIVLGFVLVFIGLFPFANKIYALLAAPMLAPFFVPMKVAMMTAFIISLPHTLYQIWAFVAPGLYSHEKKLMVPVIAASTLLFIIGMAFAYFAVFPTVFGFVVGSAPAGVAVMTDISEYLDFVMTLFMAFGLAFEVPIAVILIARFGWVSVAQLKEARSYVIVGAFILGAIFTPPDIISQFMLAVPLWLLYELGIVVARYTTPKNAATSNSIKP